MFKFKSNRRVFISSVVMRQSAYIMMFASVLGWLPCGLVVWQTQYVFIYFWTYTFLLPRFFLGWGTYTFPRATEKIQCLYELLADIGHRLLQASLWGPKNISSTKLRFRNFTSFLRPNHRVDLLIYDRN